MRRRSLFTLLLVAALALPATAATQYMVWTDQATNASTTIDTSQAREAQVTVWGSSGSPDGTVKVFVISPDGQWVLVSTYATPTTAKTYRGPTGTRLGFSLTGNTTGRVSVAVLLK